MLPQPFVTTAQTKSDAIRVALDLTEEWDKLQADSETPSALITGVAVVRKAFAEENPAAVAAFPGSLQGIGGICEQQCGSGGSTGQRV